MKPNELANLASGQSVGDWLVLGPFVVKTGPHFEREYMYERERILDLDYLAGDGGETAVNPAEGAAHANIGIGPQELRWREHPEADLLGMRIAGDIIYETVQRNCVIYAAARIESDRDCLGLLDAEHSGMKAWVNGKPVCNEPYGLTKGVRLTMPCAPIRLVRGSNLLLVKFRPGYMCDRVDFRVCGLKVSPMVSANGCPVALGRVRALPVSQGPVEKPRRAVEASLLNVSDAPVTVRTFLERVGAGAIDEGREKCPPGAVKRVLLAADGEDMVTFGAEAGGKTVTMDCALDAVQPPKHDGRVFVLSSFHFDTTYHEEQRVYAMGAFDIVRTYCRLHREDPNFRSIISEVDYLKPYADVYPEDRETLFQVFREGRSEPDVMYNQPNEQNCGGEALVRNFLYGQLIHGRVFGNICRVYGPGDVFGHPNQLSQIARKSGCIGVSWDKYIFNFPPVFDHLALDGVPLPHKREHAPLGEVRRMGLAVGTGDIDQTPPTDWHETLVPKYVQGTCGDYIAAVREECGERGARLPVVSRDMALYHAATALSRTNLKTANRLGENLLIAAEKFATVAALLGAKYPEKALDKAWRQILCGQHHDSITGTHNEISFVDLMNSYREVLELGTDVLNRSLDYIGRGIKPAGNGLPLVVFNSLAWQRTDVVRATIHPRGLDAFAIVDPNGKRVTFETSRIRRDKNGAVISADVAFTARNVPSLGCRAYEVVAADKVAPEPKRRKGTVIENEYYRIEVDPARGGGMVSLYDKKAGREVLDAKGGHVGNELAVLEEVPDREETQHEFYTTGLKRFSAESPAEVELVKGPVTSTLRVRYDMGELCGVVQEITLAKGVQRIDFRTTLVDVQGEDYLYCVTFPTKLKGAVPVFDERFGVVARNESRNYLDFRTHRQIMFSDCAVYAANKWTEYGSTALLKMGRNRYALSMVGLVTTKRKGDTAAAERLERAFIKKGVTCTPWHDTGGPHWGSYQDHMDDDLLYTRFRVSMGSGSTNRYTQKLLAAQPAKVRRAFSARLKQNGHAFLFVKDGDLAEPGWPALPVLIVEGKKPKDLDAALSALLDGFAETAVLTLPADVDATDERHTVDDYGVAMLNVGTYANSVEKDGVLCMMLNHTCRWYGGTNNFPEGYLVPENRNHVYTYSLYPHAGNWRDANTQQAAHAVNHPLLARETKPASKPCLPAEEAFLTVAPKNVILAAMKPFGNPIAGFEGAKKAAPNAGVMLRLYDTEGVDTDARVTFASGIREAWRANLLEERGEDLDTVNGNVSLPVPAFSIETAGFVPGKLGRKLGRKSLGTEAEPVQPVWVRSWEHDAESMPMGYAPVVCSISREVKEEDEGRTLRLRVNAVNDYTDCSVLGTARLSVPEGWVVEPEAMTFELPPLGHEPFDVTVQRPDANAPGQITLRHEHDGQVFQDVLEVGAAFDLEMDVENQGDAIYVTLTNPTNAAVNAEVALVTPLETWPAALVGGHTLLDISPRTQGVAVPPGESTKLKYTVRPAGRNDDLPPSYWAVAKLMVNGRIQLRRCDRRPPYRRLDDAKWTEVYEERKRYRR